MYLMGFSLNNLTLVAIVIAVGFVVDDAIVVVENIHRHLEAGLDKREAAIKGAGEIGFTVVSISFSLVAAFIPLLFMGGVVGRLFKEFALTATSTILISVVVSLTLAPTLAALFMRAPTHHAHDKPGFSERLLAGYARNLRRALAHQRTMAAIFVVTLALAVVGYVFIPKGFFPCRTPVLFWAPARRRPMCPTRTWSPNTKPSPRSSRPTQRWQHFRTRSA